VFRRPFQLTEDVVSRAPWPDMAGQPVETQGVDRPH
jgi:hypothetical protein